MSETLATLFDAYGIFLTRYYAYFISFFIMLGLIETTMVICLHAIAGHGLRFDWCFRSNLFLRNDLQTYSKAFDGALEDIKYERSKKGS